MGISHTLIDGDVFISKSKGYKFYYYNKENNVYYESPKTKYEQPSESKWRPKDAVFIGNHIRDYWVAPIKLINHGSHKEMVVDQDQTTMDEFVSWIDNGGNAPVREAALFTQDWE